MFSRYSILVATLVLCVSGILGIGFLSPRNDLGAFLLIWSSAPLLGIAAGSAWWRTHRWLPFVGLGVAAVALALTLWGNGADYLDFVRHPPKPGQIHFTPGRFFAWLLSGFLCVGFWMTGAVTWALKGTSRSSGRTAAEGRAPDDDAKDVKAQDPTSSVRTAAEGKGVSRERHRLGRAVLWLACGLYVAACVLPATERWGSVDHLGSSMGQRGGQPYTTEPGWYCLAFGWMAVPKVVEFGRLNELGLMAWLANPLAFVGMVLLLSRRNKAAAAFGAVSVVVALLYLIDPPKTNGHPDYPRVGAWLWLGSLIAVTVAALIRRVGRQTLELDEPPLHTTAVKGQGPVCP